MRVTEIVLSTSVRMNTGNFEGTEKFVSMKTEVDPLDDDVKVAADLNAKVERAMVTQLVRSYKVRGKKDMTPAKVARHHGLSHIPKEEK